MVLGSPLVSLDKKCESGWLIIDKPLGISSFRVVSLCKRVLRDTFYNGQKFPVKIGHGGTLDPLASGVLPIAVGNATKTVSFAMEKEKTYVVEVTWGEERLTDDGEGDIIHRSSYRPTQTEVLHALDQFKGRILQEPPLFCALKVDGKRVYKSARKGEAVFLKKRPVDIYGLSLLKWSRETALIEVQCGKGFYVRALARDLGRFLGTFGFVSSLRRTRVGPFYEESAISLDNLERLGHKITSQILPFDVLLDDIPALHVEWDQARRLFQGQIVRGSWDLPPERPVPEEKVVVIKSQGKALGMGCWRPSQGLLHLKRGFTEP